MALIDKLTAIADAIRGKTGKTDGMTLDQMATEISGISTGGGGGDIDALIDRSIAEVSSNATTIGKYAFNGCSNLTSADFPEATVIGESAFTNCPLTDIHFPKLTQAGYAAFQMNKFTVADFPMLTTAGNNVFYACGSLTTVNVPLLTGISQRFCQNCTKLTDVNAPSAESLDTYAFYSCERLTMLDLPKAASIAATALNGCNALTVLILRKETVCTLANVNAFTGTPFASNGTGGTVYVPQALISEYQQATNWSTLYAGGKCYFAAIEGSEYE